MLWCIYYVKLAIISNYMYLYDNRTEYIAGLC